MTRLVRYFVFSAVLWFPVFSPAQVLERSMISLQPVPVPRIGSNSVTDVFYYANRIWLGTGSGVSISEDFGQTWLNLGRENGLGKGGVSAMAFYGNSVWVATAFDTLTADAGKLPAGGGLSYSDDLGRTWHYLPQPGLTNVQNVTFDIAILDSTIWIASWGGGLKRSDNWGKSWQDVAPDSSAFDPFRHLNHRAFSVLAADGILWVGTAQGINRSTDNGKTWVNFNHQNQAQPISGNFVVALAYQRWQDRRVIWAATIEAEDPAEFRAVSYSEDYGYTWHTALKGIFAHNFAVYDSAVYVAADKGLYVSVDFGRTWAKFPPVRDVATGQPLLTEEFYAVAVSPDGTIWAGTPDGLIKSSDGGHTWQILRTYESLLEEPNVSETYAYPNPFSPLRHNQFGGEGHVRIHFRVDRTGPVSITIFDFAMKKVRDLVSGKTFAGRAEYDVAWDGRNDFDERVANGVYFYRVRLPGGKADWGKIIVMD